MIRLAILAAALFLPVSSVALVYNSNLETAARIGVALMVCDQSHGVGSQGWLHYIGIGSTELGISDSSGRELVEARQRDLLTHLNRTKGLDEFCADPLAAVGSE